MPHLSVLGSRDGDRSGVKIHIRPHEVELLCSPHACVECNFHLSPMPLGKDRPHTTFFLFCEITDSLVVLLELLNLPNRIRLCLLPRHGLIKNPAQKREKPISRGKRNLLRYLSLKSLNVLCS